MAVKVEKVYGVGACACQVASLPMLEERLRGLGVIQRDLSGLITQGAYNGQRVSASAGTHAGGGVWDVKAALVNTVAKRRAWRESGAWATHRKYLKGVWPEHGHVVWVGCPHLAGSAARQVVQFRNGTDGLASRGRDDEPRFTPIAWQDALKAWQAGKSPAPVKAPVKLFVLDASDTALSIRRQISGVRKVGDGSVKRVQEALVKVLGVRLLLDGMFGPVTRSRYVEWQKRCGFRGAAADGVPGFESLSRLGKASGLFAVKR